MFDKEWYPGEILNTADEDLEIKCMMRVSKNSENLFVWPEKDDVSWFSTDDIICSVDPPTPVNNRAFALSERDVTLVKNNL